MARDRAPAGAARSSRCELALRGSGATSRGSIFQRVLLLTLVVSLGGLIVLLWTCSRRRSPVLLDRGCDFFTCGYSSLRQRAGVRQGLSGRCS